MKRLAALMLAVVLFAAPAVALADDWNGPSLEQIFGQNYVDTIVMDTGG